MVVGAQTLISLAGAHYPPLVQGLHCNFVRPGGQAEGDGATEADLGDAGALPAADAQAGRIVPTVTAGDDMDCRLDAPGADYAAWAVTGRVPQFRAGPLNPDMPCQDGQAFAAQNPDTLRLSMCQRFRLTQPGLYTLVAKVTARGSNMIDRGQMSFLVQPATPQPPPAPEPPIATRLKATLILPAQQVTQTRTVPVSEALSEHGLLPTSRDFVRTVYRLAPSETYVGSSFQAISASNASNTRVYYAPDRSAVMISFTLRSGPLVDKWRGWLSGNVVVRVGVMEDAQNVVLPDIDLKLPGQTELDLPDTVPVARLDGATLKLTRSETGSTGEETLGGSVTLDDVRITSKVEGDKLMLEARGR
jgi:hypothetical protein